MAEERRPPRRRRKRRRNPIVVIIAFFFICGALLLGVSVFFKISVIKAEGSVHYTSEQIIAASGVKKGDNLFFVNKFDAMSKIFKQLPYAGTITVKRDLPDGIIFKITDAEPAAYIQSGDKYWLFDKSLKLLELVGKEKISGYIPISGVSLSQPEAGQKLKLSDSTKQAAMLQLFTEFNNRNILKGIKNIDLTNATDIKFVYLDRFNVKLGNSEDLKDKLDLMVSAVSSKQIGTAGGTIDLSQNKEAHFIPD